MYGLKVGLGKPSSTFCEAALLDDFNTPMWGWVNPCALGIKSLIFNQICL